MQPVDKQILIIEDNKRSMEKAYDLLKQIDGVFIHKAANSGDAYLYALEYHIDLFIVDIILNTNVPGDVAGTKFVENIRKLDKYAFTPIIFTTSLEDADLYAYAQLHCYRYFEKPYDNEEFIKVVREALRFESVKKERRFYKYKKDGVHYTVKVQDVIYFHNNKNNVYVHCTDGTILETPYKSTNQILLELNSDRFLKCNRNTVVNIDFVSSVDTANKCIKLTNDPSILELGNRMKHSFLEGVSKCSK